MSYLKYCIAWMKQKNFSDWAVWLRPPLYRFVTGIERNDIIFVAIKFQFAVDFCMGLLFL